MSNLGEQAMEILGKLHTERLAYESEYVPLADAANLLTAYEQTGMDPEAIERVVDAYGRGLTLREDAAERLEIIRGLSTARLRELAEADRDGRCVVLPCKVGAKVYALEDRSYWKDVPCLYENECEVCDTDCHYYRQEMVEETEIVGRVVVSTGEMESVMRGLGKTVFLTREAAEAALKGEQDATKV